MMIDQLPAEAIDALVQAVGPGGPFPLVSVEVRHLDGEVARPAPATAHWPAWTRITCSPRPT